MEKTTCVFYHDVLYVHVCMATQLIIFLACLLLSCRTTYAKDIERIAKNFNEDKKRTRMLAVNIVIHYSPLILYPYRFSA